MSQSHGSLVWGGTGRDTGIWYTIDTQHIQNSGCRGSVSAARLLMSPLWPRYAACCSICISVKVETPRESIGKAGVFPPDYTTLVNYTLLHCNTRRWNTTSPALHINERCFYNTLPREVIYGNKVIARNSFLSATDSWIHFSAAPVPTIMVTSRIG